jgi:TolA-binding protein
MHIPQTPQTTVNCRFAAVTLAFLVLWGDSQSTAQEDTDPATHQYTVAATLQNRGDYDRAVNEWSRFIAQYRTDPRLDRAHYYQGVCQLRLNRPQDAARSFQTVLDQYPKSELHEESRLQLGMAQYGAGQQGKAEMYDRAAATLRAVLAAAPQGKSAPQALFYLGECLYQRGKKQEAIQSYEALLTRFPEAGLVADALYALAVAQQEVNQPAAAEKSLALFLQRFPENQLATEVLMRRGDALFALGEYEAAAQCLATAAAKPDFELADYAAFRQAAAVAEQKRFAEAARLYAAMAARFPRSAYAAEARLAAGKHFLEAGDLTAAQTILGRVVDKVHASEAAHWTARILLRQRKPAEALAAAERGVTAGASGPMVAQLLLDQADALYELPGRRGDAAARYAAVAEKYPRASIAPQAAYLASVTALAERDYAHAFQYAQSFLQRYPGNAFTPDVTHVAAESQLQLGKPAEAATLFGRLLQGWATHADAAMWRVRCGLALYMARDYRGAIDTLEPSVAKLSTPELHAEALYVIGSSQLELGQADQAAATLSASLAAAPGWRLADETLLGLAEAQRQKQDLPAAQASLAKLIRDYPQSGTLERASYRLGEYRYAAGDLRGAAAQYAQVVKRWPQGALLPHALHGLAWARLGSGELPGAVEAASMLIARFGHDKLAHRARYARGLARQQLGQLQDAADDLTAFLKNSPGADRSDARYALALCQVGLKQYAEAVATLTGLLEDDPQYAAADRVLYELAWAEQSRGRPAEAAAAFRRLGEKYSVSPLAAESLFHAGEYAYQQGDYAAAGIAYHAAMEKAAVTPLGEKAAHRLGWAFWRMKDLANAQTTFSYQRKTWPEGPLAADATFLEAECLLEQKKYEEALRLYAGVKNPTGKDFALLALLHAGQAAGHLGRWAESLRWLERAATQFPHSPLLAEVLFEQAQVQQNLGQRAEAVRLYQQVITKSEGEVAARAQFMIGRVQVEEGKQAEAVKSFYKVAYGYSFARWQAAAMYAAGQSLEALKNVPQAVKQYRELVDKFPQSEEAAAARQRIKSLEK